MIKKSLSIVSCFKKIKIDKIENNGFSFLNVSYNRNPFRDNAADVIYLPTSAFICYNIEIFHFHLEVNPIAIVSYPISY